MHGSGVLTYPDGKKYEGEFINGKRHGEGIFTYPDGTAFIGKFIAGKQDGLGTCINVDGSSVPCQSKTDTQVQDFSGKDVRNVSIVARKWIRISQYEANSKKGKKIMDKLKKFIKNKKNCRWDRSHAQKRIYSPQISQNPQSTRFLSFSSKKRRNLLI